jgi:hypothetical protein
MPIEMNFRPFELDNRDRRSWLALFEMAENGVGRSLANVEMLLKVPDGFIFGGPLVAEGFAEYFAKEQTLKLRLGELGEPAAAFEIGPALENRVGLCQLVRVFEVRAVGLFLDKASEKEWIGLRLPSCERR